MDDSERIEHGAFIHEAVAAFFGYDRAGIYVDALENLGKGVLKRAKL
jgi:hypothetical protein